MAKLFKLFTDNRGVSAIEYALIASLISVAAISAFATLGSEVNDNYEEIDEELANSL